MSSYKAFLFDLNGTMIDDMSFHLTAWHDILTNDLGASLTTDDVKKQMYGKNDDLLSRVFGAGRFTPDQLLEISIEKERRYQKAFLPHLKLIEGLDDFLLLAVAQDIKLAIGSAAIPFNIDFVLDNLGIRHLFKAVVSAHDVENSKPHPETYLKAASLLGVDPKDCIVFEDAPKGVEAAYNAGMKSIAITNLHMKEEFDEHMKIELFIKDYRDPALMTYINK